MLCISSKVHNETRPGFSGGTDGNRGSASRGVVLSQAPAQNPRGLASLI